MAAPEQKRPLGTRLGTAPQGPAIKYLDDEEWMRTIFNILRIPCNDIIWYATTVGAACFVALSLWAIYLFLEAFNLRTFLQYAPYSLVESYLAASLVLWLASSKVLVSAIVELKKNTFWNLEMVSERMQRQILRECRYLQRLYWSHVIPIEILVGHNLYLWGSDPAKYSIVSRVVVQHFPAFSSYFHWLLTSAAIPLSVSIVSFFWFSLYLVSYLKFQLYMLGDRIESFTQSTGRKNDMKLVFVEKYQKEMKENLRFFICRHQAIIQASADVKKITAQYNFCFALMSTMLSCYTIFTVFSDLYSWFTTCLALGTFMITTFTIAQRFQYFEDTAEEFAQIVDNLPWYLWNMENLRTFTIFHQYTSRGILELPFPPYIIKCDYTMIKAFTKLLFTLANFFHSTSST